MPSGFIGNASRVFLIHVSNVFERANRAANSTRTPNRITERSRRQLRIPSPGEANSGSFQTGVGDSSNIVVSTHVYNEALRAMDQIDEQMGELFHRITTELEEMCRTIYVVPQTAPRYLSICGRVKGSLGQFRSLPGDTRIRAQRFVSRITDIT